MRPRLSRIATPGGPVSQQVAEVAMTKSIAVPPPVIPCCASGLRMVREAGLQAATLAGIVVEVPAVVDVVVDTAAVEWPVVQPAPMSDNNVTKAATGNANRRPTTLSLLRLGPSAPATHSAEYLRPFGTAQQVASRSGWMDTTFYALVVSSQSRRILMIPSAREASSGPCEGKLTRRCSSCWAARTAAASDTD